MTARYQRIQIMKKDYALTALCTAFAVSRAGYYVWRDRPPSARQQATTQLLAEIQTLRQGEEASYGSPRMTEELQARGYACSENRIARRVAWPVSAFFRLFNRGFEWLSDGYARLAGRMIRSLASSVG